MTLCLKTVYFQKQGNFSRNKETASKTGDLPAKVYFVVGHVSLQIYSKPCQDVRRLGCTEFKVCGELNSQNNVL